MGLAIGIVLIAKVSFELSYDKFYKDVNRIYLIKSEWPQPIILLPSSTT